jgi:hypothetical protein
MTSAYYAGSFRERARRAQYVIYGLVPRRTGRGLFRGTGGAGGTFLKKRHPVATARDAHEALMELIRLRDGQSGSYGQGRWHFIVVEQGAGRGKLAPIVSEDELRRRAAAGRTDPRRRSHPRRRDAERSHLGMFAGHSYHAALTAARAEAKKCRTPWYIKQQGQGWWMTDTHPTIPYVKVHVDERAIKHLAGDPRRRRTQGRRRR